MTLSATSKPLPPPPKDTPALIDYLLDFVRVTGLVVVEAALPTNTFLPGLLLRAGQLVVDRQQLLYPGDILHEAGHLAVSTAAERPAVGGNITEHDPGKEGEEMAVHCWCYAACVALNLPAEVVFHPAGYRGASAWFIENFQQGRYIGLPLLVWMELTTTQEYPRMTRWLRP
ncbi:hypothetical protein [Hymenobacter rubripertinctus]|uniref:IrrE N-terminal-like domain-containing protein n=1 Tax=Hymenobacter rubripertinctus TaxID=2029981 RepID=A0A418QV39_9BACT|nr:hypothetical protein [Hymenobacter rubripertinctus]RIY09096.1 hypothetical protein D0T11_13055 [Hymenobacter rubripertinctus]